MCQPIEHWRSGWTGPCGSYDDCKENIHDNPIWKQKIRFITYNAWNYIGHGAKQQGDQ